MEIKVCGSVAPICYGNHNCSSFLVSENVNKVLLDCGPGSSRMIDIYRDLKKLAIFISHYHPDHYSDIFALGNASYVNHKLGFLDEEVSVYLPKPDMYQKAIPIVDKDGRETCDYVEAPIDDYEFIKKTKHEHYMQFFDYQDDSQITLGDMQLSFTKTKHPLNTYATKITSPNGTVVYSADTGYQGNTLTNFAKDADLLICESSFLRGQTRSEDYHLYAHEAGKIAAQAHVKNLIIFHTYPGIPPADYVKEAKEYFPNTSAANEGDIYELINHKVLKKENKEEIK